MPFPFILAATAPAAISTLQAWIIGTSVVVGAPAVAGGGWMMYRWFRPAKSKEIVETNTPLAKVSKESMESHQTIGKEKITQALLVQRSETEVLSVRQSASQLSVVAVNVSNHYDSIQERSVPLKAEISRLLRNLQQEKHLISGLSERLEDYINQKRGGKLNMQQELTLLRNILSYRESCLEKRETHLRFN